MIDNLTEAISHAREVAENVRYNAYTFTERDLLDENCRQAKAECLDCATEHEQLAAWLEELAERREADRWIPVTERLPDKNGNYLVLLNNGEMTTDIFDEEELFMGFWGYMTHWRPLPPKPYESEDK